METFSPLFTVHLYQCEKTQHPPLPTLSVMGLVCSSLASLSMCVSQKVSRLLCCQVTVSQFALYVCISLVSSHYWWEFESFNSHQTAKSFIFIYFFQMTICSLIMIKHAFIVYSEGCVCSIFYILLYSLEVYYAL